MDIQSSSAGDQVTRYINGLATYIHAFSVRVSVDEQISMDSHGPSVDTLKTRACVYVDVCRFPSKSLSSMDDTGLMTTTLDMYIYVKTHSC